MSTQTKTIGSQVMNKRIVRLLAEIDKTKVRVAALRDKLREQVEDLTDIIESCDESVNFLDDGKRAFEDAVSEMSKFL